MLCIKLLTNTQMRLNLDLQYILYYNHDHNTIHIRSYSCYFTCRCNRTREENESQQTQHYPAAEDPHKRERQGGLPRVLGKPRGRLPRQKGRSGYEVECSFYVC